MQEIQDTKAELSSVQFLFATLNEGQQKSGAFTLLDCKNILMAYQAVSKFFENPNGSIQEASNSFDTILKAVSVLQSKGAFTISSSAEILDRIEFVQGFFVKK